MSTTEQPLPSTTECENAYNEYRYRTLDPPRLYRPMCTGILSESYQQLLDNTARVVHTSYGIHISPNQFAYRSNDGTIGYVVRTRCGRLEWIELSV